MSKDTSGTDQTKIQTLSPTWKSNMDKYNLINNKTTDDKLS